jgi:RND family efflux transporter MFP subunit
MRYRLLSFLSLIVLLLTGCSQKAEENSAKTVPVRIYSVKAESISNYIHATGSVEGDEDVIVYSKVSERVEKVNIRPGEAVTKDQILVEQRNEVLRQSLEIAQAALKTAEGQAKLAALDYERLRKLYSEKAISPQQHDQAKTAKETAEHAGEQARSMYEQAREQFENSLIKAPFDGVAAAVYVEKNQTITMGQPVVQILSPSKMKAKIYLTGADIQQVRIGQRVQIQFPTLPGKEFSGRVDKINTAIDQTTKTLEVEIGFLSNDKRITSGLFGEFSIETLKNAGRLVIPETALIPQTEIRINRETGLQNTVKRFFLYVIENKAAHMREVKTGIANNGQIEIANGLTLGDSVIIVGQNIVKDGQPVNVIK